MPHVISHFDWSGAFPVALLVFPHVEIKVVYPEEKKSS